MTPTTRDAAGGGTVRMKPVAVAARVGAVEREPLPEGMSVALEVIEGAGLNRVVHVMRRLVTIGRVEGEILIDDAMISRRHASLEVHDFETIILRDLSSTNGTYHNDQLVAFCKVQDGDEIRLGSTTLTVQVDVVG